MRKIAILAEPGATASSIVTTLDMFRVAARLEPQVGHRLDLYSTRGGSVALGEALALETLPLPESLADYDAVILPGFFANSAEHIAAQLETTWQAPIARLRELRGGPLVAASCYGTFALAEAGLLDGKPATTTWWMEQAFRQRYPAVQLDADLALSDSGDVVTAGAMTAHTELSLHVLRRLGGVALARGVGSVMLVDGAKASQRPFMTAQRTFDAPLVDKAMDWLAARIGQATSIDALASEMCVSYRTLNRRFLETTGRSPLACLHELRIERAKELLECTAQAQEEITRAVGYEDLSSFRRLFKRATGLTPAQYRQQFRRARG